ncbi:hypothetical protein Adt_03846 [Abeliophyllum distichum]|uniref:Uncharacterized protein n=1 Tax=Abeliophyllum distichum TaxID=126358 RepID=A0ABD1W227_9LAMI
MDKGKLPRPTMAHFASKKSKALAPGPSEDSKHKNVIEDLSRDGNRDEADKADVVEIDESVEAAEEEVPLSRKRKVGTSSQVKKKTIEVMDNYTVCSPPPLQRMLSITDAGEIVLEISPKLHQSSEDSDGRPYDSKRKLRELIGPLWGIGLQEILQSQVQ